MWIVRVALNRPYTFIVLALLLLIISPLVILRTPADIFPNVNIPVIAVLWNYPGLSAEEMEERIASPYERSLTTVGHRHRAHRIADRQRPQHHQGLFPSRHARRHGDGADDRRRAERAPQMPPGTTPPYMLVYSASSVPILQLALSGKDCRSSNCSTYAANFIRTQLATVQGAAIPWPYGGKQRQVMIDLQPALLQAKGLSPADVVNAISTQNLILPAGTSKIGQFEYDVELNASPETVQELNDLPIKAVGNSTIYMHDVAHVRDGFSPQTNIVRRDGQRGALLSILKIGDASTLDIVKQVRDMLPQIAATLPPAAQDRADRRSVHLRARRRQRRGSRSHHRRVPDRDHDSAVSGKLAQHAHHRHLDSAFDSGFHLRAERAGRNHQHHDAGRLGAGGRHSGGRRHGRNRKHRPQSAIKAKTCITGDSGRRARRSPCRRWSPRSASASCSCRCSS